MLRGQVVKLDRGYPLVKTTEGSLVRCEHAIALVKGHKLRAVIGDWVQLEMPKEHDKGIIVALDPRKTEFVRKDPAERAAPQVLAANFDLVLIAQPLSALNFKRLERELVLAFETRAKVGVVLTKADLADEDTSIKIRTRVEQLVGLNAHVVVVSAQDPSSIEELRALVPAHSVAVLVGKSGVGKSSLVNMLVGNHVQQTAAVRANDGKGRHTTVSRQIIDIPGGGSVVDMPGVRGLGLWDAEVGLGAAFGDIECAAHGCHFRDCLHENEPGCAVRKAVHEGCISPARLAAYQSLRQESEKMKGQREEARHSRGEKASTAPNVRYKKRSGSFKKR